MPTYEYGCDACGHRFERRQHFNEEPINSCPLCQGKSRRLIYSIPIIFKGSGFYITDNRKEQNPDSFETKVKQDESTPAKSS